MKFAAIDIGSNAVRLLLMHVFESPAGPVFKKLSLVRLPIRLGESAFAAQPVPEAQIGDLVKAMNAFRLLMEVHNVHSYKACATSALREAVNGAEIAQRLKTETGINVQIIDGKEEARIIYSNHIEEQLNKGGNYLYIDVGGGSTELTFIAGGKIIASESFMIGTVRMLQHRVLDHVWDDMKSFLKTHTKGYSKITAIGSGGNINTIIKLTGKKESKPMSVDTLDEINTRLLSMTVDERILNLRMNPDRADVVVPAARIFLFVMKTASAKEIIVPQIGLSDGLIHLLYEEYIASFS